MGGGVILRGSAMKHTDKGGKWEVERIRWGDLECWQCDNTGLVTLVPLVGKLTCPPSLAFQLPERWQSHISQTEKWRPKGQGWHLSDPAFQSCQTVAAPSDLPLTQSSLLSIARALYSGKPSSSRYPPRPQPRVPHSITHLGRSGSVEGTWVVSFCCSWRKTPGVRGRGSGAGICSIKRSGRGPRGRHIPAAGTL